MKILLVADIHQRMISGVYVSTMNLARGLKEMGHDVKLFIVSDRGYNVKTRDSYQIASFDASMFYPNIRLVFPFSDVLHLRDIIKWKPDVIHTQTEFFTMSRALYIARRLNIPVIHTYHTSWGDPEYLKYFNRYLKGLVKESTVGTLLRHRLYTDYIAALIAPTEKTKEILESYGINKPTYIIPSGIDLSRFNTKVDEEFIKAKKREFNFSENDKIMLFVGRVGKEKNINEIIKYFLKLKTEMKNLKFLIVGGGPETENLKKMAADTEYKDDIVFTGLIKTDVIHKYYPIGDVFVTASQSETQGITYIEAMASHVPVLCKADKCIEGLIENGVNGLTFTDYESFKTGLETILFDEVKRQQLIDEASKVVSTYTIEHFTQSVFNVYQKAVEERRIGSRRRKRILIN